MRPRVLGFWVLIRSRIIDQLLVKGVLCYWLLIRQCVPQPYVDRDEKLPRRDKKMVGAEVENVEFCLFTESREHESGL
jgi:hypothetical protein